VSNEGGMWAHNCIEKTVTVVTSRW